MFKELLSACAILLTLIAFFPYIRSILQGKTRPHAFSWVTWSVTVQSPRLNKVMIWTPLSPTVR